MTSPILSDFSELLLQLYALSHALPVDEFQDAALGLLKKVVPFDTSMWGTATITPVGIDIHTIHLHRTSTEMLVEYEPHKAHDTPAATVIAQPMVTAVFHSPTAVADAGLRDFLERFGHQNMFITAKTDPVQQFVHYISLYRADRHAHCTENERLWLERLRPHLMQTLSLNRGGHLGKPSEAHWGLTGAQAVADLRGVVQHADPSFEALLKAEWPAWRGGQLPAPLLRHFLRGEAVYCGASLVVKQHTEHQLLFLRARPRCKADTLSERQLEVAVLVAQGQSHKVVAQRLGLAPSTVRNHLQAIYDKLEVGKVAGLVDALRRAGAL